ncbi:anti-sigma factor family protein [Streptomyces mayteni]
MSSAAETGPADHHLGESLAALVDGELSHDSRDRVLAHLATCPSCKAEADAQRELKSVFASSPLPAPSAGLLARLQGLPAAAGRESADPEPPGPAAGSGANGTSSGFRLGLLPGGKDRESLLGPPTLGNERGFRIHHSGPARGNRSHRLAFAAAGAVSLAAFALGGVVGGVGSLSAGGGGSSAPSAVAPGSGATPVVAARTAGGRSDKDIRPVSVLTAQAVGLRGPLGPVAPSGQLLPLFTPDLVPGPVAPTAGASALAAESAIPGVVSPR